MLLANTITNTRKITYSAVATTLSIVAMALTLVLPLKISLLLVCSVCYYLILEKCKLVYGLLTIAASLLIMFFIGGFSSPFILNAIIFAPYSILAYYIKRFRHNKAATCAIREVIVVAFANLALMGVFFLMKYVSFDIAGVISNLGGYWVLAIIISVFAIVFDFLFVQIEFRLCQVIK